MQHPPTETTHRVSDLMSAIMPGKGDGTFERPTWGLGELDPTPVKHPGGGICMDCRKDLDDLWQNGDQKHEDGRWLFRGFRPVTICETCYGKRKSATYSAGEAAWQKACPIEFKALWEADRGDDHARMAAMKFEPLQRKGMVIHGLSGAGKTRIAWLVARKVAESGRTWLWVDSLDYVDTVPKEAAFVDVLFLDDFGNEPLGQIAETRLLRLIKTRTEQHRPIVITTQHQGDSLSKRFRESATAQAVVRRLREFCDSVYVKARP